MACILAVLALILGPLAALYLYGVRRLIFPAFERSTVTPADHGLPFEDVWFGTSDGLRLHGWLVPAGRPRGTVIFLHGHGGTPAPDLVYVPAFRERGFTVLLLEFRAHGQSEGRFTSVGYFERRDLAAAVRFLEARGVRRVGLLGFSMGAVVAMAGAGDLPAVAAVVADCGFAELSSAAAFGARARGIPPFLTGIVGRLIVLVASLRLGAPLWAADPIRNVGRISPRPLLIIQAGRDEYVPVSDARRLFAAAGEPKELWIEPEAQHRGVDQVVGERYLERVLGFFERWLGEG
ncbi:MAG: alpha/beta fold hydrolase [Anaerolineae bacterium]|nr:alpha/beta fold hydrolase [Anaerolineae bacterium]